MKWDEVIERIETIEKLGKGPICIKRQITKSYSKISVFVGIVRQFDITSSQMNKLEKKGYNIETIIF